MTVKDAWPCAAATAGPVRPASTLSITAGKWTPGELIERLWDRQDRFPGASIHD